MERALSVRYDTAANSLSGAKYGPGGKRGGGAGFPIPLSGHGQETSSIPRFLRQLRYRIGDCNRGLVLSVARTCNRGLVILSVGRDL